MSPAGTLCFDIFSPPSGDSDVISHVDLLSSNETNIATRSLRIAFGASGRSATVCMVVSRVGGRNLTLLERRSLSTSPWDLDKLVAPSCDRIGGRRGHQCCRRFQIGGRHSDTRGERTTLYAGAARRGACGVTPKTFSLFF